MDEMVSRLDLKHGDVILLEWASTPSQVEIHNCMETCNRVAEFLRETRGINVWFWMLDSTALKINILSDTKNNSESIEKKYRMIRLREEGNDKL